MTSSTAPSILVVEDNPITRRMFRVALQAAGYAVVEAGSGKSAIDEIARARPALVLQDLRLPDMSGFELLRKLRTLPEGKDIPILAVSGLLSRSDEERLAGAPFNDLLAKPIEPSTLLATIRGYLPLSPPPPPAASTGRRVLVVDDEPLQRKLLCLRLAQIGFQTEAAVDGRDALARARERPPDAVMSDILMPNLDGFGLCQEIRRDARTAHVPVVLLSSEYVEAGDRDLAARMGADACLVRTPDFKAAIEALQTSLGRPARTTAAEPEAVIGTHLERTLRQLDRDMALNARLVQRNTRLAAELGALQGISDVLAGTQDTEAALPEILARCIEAGGVSEGALYLRLPEAAGLSLVASCGFSGASPEELETFFGHAEVIRAITEERGSLHIPSDAVSEAVTRDVLTRSGVAGLVLAPVGVQGTPAGALVMGSQAGGLDTEDWLVFAHTVGVQIGQALALSRAHRQNQLLLDSAGEGIWGLDLRGNTTFVNPAATAMLGYEPGELMSRPMHETVHALETADSPDGPPCELANPSAGPTGVGGVDTMFRRKDGSTFPAVYVRSPIVEHGRPRGTVVVFKDVSERRRARELTELERTRRQQLQIQDQFFSHVSHELRTPLAALHQFATILLDGLAGELQPEQREYLEIVVRNATHLRSMINDLLETTRADPSRLAVVARPTSLRELIDSVVETLGPTAAGKDVALSVSVDPDLPPAWADPTRVGQILINLVDNAIKFTPGQGQVVVRATVSPEEPDRLCVAVADTGPGIPAEELGKVFDYMYQGANTAELTRKGFGIGLHVCRELIARQGGRIWVESQPGQGSTFSFTLPALQGIGPAASDVSRQEGIR